MTTSDSVILSRYGEESEFVTSYNAASYQEQVQ